MGLERIGVELKIFASVIYCRAGLNLNLVFDLNN
jgi:hypothetical protein